jgi:hypothetical protein
MRILRMSLIAATLLVVGCGPNRQSANSSSATAPTDERVPFVSVPELKDVMCCMVEVFAETLWNAGLDQEPKTDDDWRPLEHAAIGLVETGRFIQKSHLAKNNDDWVEHAQAMIDASLAARATIKERNLEKVMAAGEKLLTTCESCHKKYFNPPPDLQAE